MKKTFKRICAVSLAIAMAAAMLPGSVGKAAYSFQNDYTLGYRDDSIVVYKGGTSYTPVADSDITIFDKQTDRPFRSEIKQAWDAKDIKLTMPVKYTTDDGKVHDVESMLTNFDFIADPTAIDNSDVDGKLYVYGTTEGFSYTGGTLVENKYANHSLTILSTEDMVNWTDEGFMDSANLTNEPSDSTNIVKGRFTSGNSWAPSGLKIDGDGDGDDEFYIFYTNGGSVGYVMGDSPTGPWRDPLGRALFTRSSPNCSGVVWCFDPGVLSDDKGNAYVYFGGGIQGDNYSHGKTGRVCKIKFAEGTGEVSMDGEPQILDTYYFFEDSEFNQFNGLYYYSYCANFYVPEDDEWTRPGAISVYVCSDPMKDMSFDPAGENGDKYTDDDGVYHHYLGMVLDNPSTIYGEFYNNHHHMQEFKGHFYILYHSTVLSNSIYHINRQYRNLHVDEIKVDKETDMIDIKPSYEGAKQIESYNPFKTFTGEEREINATTTSYSAGVKSTRSDIRIWDGKTPMVLDEIDTGDWTKIQGVDFGKKGTVKITAEINSETDKGAIELFVDDPTKPENKVATMNVFKTDKDYYEETSADINPEKLFGVHDIYFVFRGSDYTVASWKFTEGSKVVEIKPTPAPTPANNNNNVTLNQSVTVEPTSAEVGKISYKLNSDGTAEVTKPVNKAEKNVVIPDSITVNGKAYSVTSIAAGAFSGNKKLTSVTIGKNVKKIGKKAFFKCGALKKILVKGTVLKSVGAKALKGTAAKLKIKVPKSKLKAYKKLFKGKGQGKKAKVTK